MIFTVAIIIILAAVVGPLLANVVGFLVGAATTVALVGAGTYGGYRIGRTTERRQLGRGGQW